jgi:hypothetical protein
VTSRWRLAAVGLLSFLLPACGASADPAYTSVPFDGEVPQFVGPWAADLTDLYASSKSDLEREVLADEVITEEEFLALEDWYVGCMAGQGLTVTVEELGYDLGTDDQGVILAAEGVCKTDTLSVALDMRSNPDNLPWNEIVPDCLIRHGAVDPSFTREEYWANMTAVPMSDEWIGFLPTDEFQACMNDPMDLLGLYPADA